MNSYYMNDELYIEVVTYCIDRNYPAYLTHAMLTLASSTSRHNLMLALDAWKTHHDDDTDDFTETVEEITSEEPFFCECGRVVWINDTSIVEGGEQVCDEYCVGNYYYCDSCEELVGEATRISGSWYCESCRDRYYNYCDYCDQYFHEDDGHTHEEPEYERDYGCMCEAPHMEFKFPADGHGAIEQDERLTVELASGTIDEQGLLNIKDYLYNHIANWHTNYLTWEQIAALVDDLGPMWHMERGGSFTKRLQKALCQNTQGRSTGR